MTIRELSYTPPALPTQSTQAPPTQSSAATSTSEPSAFADLVRGFSREADRGEATVRGVLAPTQGTRPLDSTQLLALQAGIYRYGETMDLAARLVDKASSGVKSVIQAQ